MNSYKIYLTKSAAVSRIIANGLSSVHKTEDILSISSGSVDGNEKIPAVYYGKGYYYCTVEMAPHGEDTPTYELTIC